jgi:EAL domain-containing protein (putative c-di-GMP-specific phosphodiesterase class I)
MIMPSDFIPLADETGIILAINRQLLPEACRQLRAWQQRFPSDPPLSLSVNISPKQFSQADLASQIAQLLEQGGMDASCVDLEITETIAMADAEKSAGVLNQLLVAQPSAEIPRRYSENRSRFCVSHGQR